MEKIKITLENKKEILVDKGIEISEIIKENHNKDVPITMAKFNGKIVELYKLIFEDGKLEFIDIRNSIGMTAYIRTVQFIFINATLDLFPKARISIEHSLGGGLYGEIYKEEDLTENDLIKIEKRMREIINGNHRIKKVNVTKEEAIEIFRNYGMEDKLTLLKYSKNKFLKLYYLCGRYDYFYGQMAYSTGIIGKFEIMYYKPGFILRYPTIHEPSIIPKFKEQKKLAKIFRETEVWGNILNVANVGSLNDIVVSGEINEMVMISEAFQEKKIANIADLIFADEKIKIVLIAGPSSSGKTTFTKRLGIQLRVNGLIPIQISLDDYFVNRDRTPKDENGDYDFESIYALDLELFNANLTELLEGKKVKLPRYDFLTGERVWGDKEIYIPENGVLLIEGIHGLNEILTSSINKENKFKIYISALTQLNLDNHNRIATTDVRIIRRIVRDYLSRGYKAEDTLKMWHSIKKGEEKNIFPFQEEADVMFNSTLVYELCVLKKYALPELKKINEESTVYYEAKRLISFLNFFKTVDAELVPGNSILKEFTGGSVFYKY
ncbi:nucleoside kinase [Clostridium grantii]|uniref:Uridine kinase n=1 Tax=Clostridium grantii DSM 8605 TaxID=1121316 RepID=A0A1M5RSG2_9CLOT|nr:nucleoside kinase [Clostridium grantii]SHH29215.1 uridine kinase [Clostridium grantii DSM 8605]